MYHVWLKNKEGNKKIGQYHELTTARQRAYNAMSDGDVTVKDGNKVLFEYETRDEK